jgi:hypothetical protein
MTQISALRQIAMPPYGFDLDICAYQSTFVFCDGVRRQHPQRRNVAERLSTHTLGLAMSLKVIGVGVGRTGTYSLKLAITQLGFGPCHHMEEVAKNLPVQLPLWQAALRGQTDWAAIYDGFESAVDWPTARFFRELNAAYPEAKFILGHRDARTWAESFGATIYKLISEADQAPEHLREWLAMVSEVIRQTGIPMGRDLDGLEAAFTAHISAVKAEIPAERLLVYEVKEGWEPLCSFLGVAEPDGPFPRTNNRSEFWDLVESVS